jgi:hypothetical protein
MLCVMAGKSVCQNSARYSTSVALIREFSESTEPRRNPGPAWAEVCAGPPRLRCGNRIPLLNRQRAGLDQWILVSGSTWYGDTLHKLCGRVWNGTDGPAILCTYDANEVSRELYKSEQNAGRDRAGVALRCKIPTVANDHGCVSARHKVGVYGLMVAARAS